MEGKKCNERKKNRNRKKERKNVPGGKSNKARRGEKSHDFYFSGGLYQEIKACLHKYIPRIGSSLNQWLPVK